MVPFIEHFFGRPKSTPKFALGESREKLGKFIPFLFKGTRNVVNRSK